jgi:hypothetical protein
MTLFKLLCSETRGSGPSARTSLCTDRKQRPVSPYVSTKIRGILRGGGLAANSCCNYFIHVVAKLVTQRIDGVTFSISTKTSSTGVVLNRDFTCMSLSPSTRPSALTGILSSLERDSVGVADGLNALA